MDKLTFHVSHAPWGNIVETDYTQSALDMANSIERNGAYIPCVTHVITDVKTKKSVPVLGADGKQLKDAHNNLMFKKVALERPIHTTVVEFADGSKVTVKCSCHDTPNVETAIVNAIVKRAFGKVDWKTGLVDGDGTGTYIRHLAESAFNVKENDAKQKAAKAKAKEEAAAKQKAESEAARAKRIARKAKDAQEWLEALESLGLAVKTTTIKAPETVQPNEKPCCSCEEMRYDQGDAAPCCCEDYQEKDTIPYVRPNKPFSQFTQDEKRAYWRAQKRGCL